MHYLNNSHLFCLNPKLDFHNHKPFQIFQPLKVLIQQDSGTCMSISDNTAIPKKEGSRPFKARKWVQTKRGKEKGLAELKRDNNMCSSCYIFRHCNNYQCIWLIDLLVFYSNFSSISAISWRLSIHIYVETITNYKCCHGNPIVSSIESCKT